MASNAIILVDLIPLACIIVNLGYLLIDPSLGGAMTIVYGDREAITVDDRDGVRQRASAPPTQAANASQNCLAVHNPYP